VVRAEPPAEPVRAAGPASSAEAAGRSGTSDPFDLFAGLPRLTPLPDDVELLPDAPASDGERRNPTEQGFEAAGGYHGRRRAVEADESSGGGRRRAPDDAPDDLFARLRRR
jgi:hypothetical protein